MEEEKITLLNIMFYYKTSWKIIIIYHTSIFRIDNNFLCYLSIEMSRAYLIVNIKTEKNVIYYYYHTLLLVNK